MNLAALCRSWPALAALAVAAACGGTTGPGGNVGATSPGRAAGLDLVPVAWLEPAGEPPSGPGENVSPERGRAFPLFRRVSEDDPRRAEWERLLQTESANVTRALVSHAWKRYGRPSTWNGGLPIVIREGGNNAGQGFRLQQDDGIEDHPDVPFIILDATAESLGDTILHEGGHLLHSTATGGRREHGWWTAILHTTFAVTDPLTALSEGYAIHLEAMRGHFGMDPAKRAFYHRLQPDFEGRGTRRAEFFAPVADLMTFSQTWARYQGVRDATPVFSGHVYAGDYLRSQFDPARDRAALRRANAMISSEGAVASVLFWTAAGLAAAGGAVPGEGLDQPAVVAAETAMLAAFAALPEGNAQVFRPDVIDFVSAVGSEGSPERRIAVSRFVDLTRGATAIPGIRERWRGFYESGLALDFDRANALFLEMEEARVDLVEAALADPAVLRARVGPILPVRVEGVKLALKALGMEMPLGYDLNAADEAELAATPRMGETLRAKVLAELEREPFTSFDDFEKRCGCRLSDLGLVVVTPPAGPLRQEGLN